MCVSFLFLDEAGLCECLSQNRRGRARMLPTHLPGTDDVTLAALALHSTRGTPRWVEIVGGGGTLWVFHFMDDQGFDNCLRGGGCE